MDIRESQIEKCKKYGADCDPPDSNLVLGISKDFFSNKLPINGLRHPAEGNSCGWYLWIGEEISDAQDYFRPIHVSHLVEKFPKLIPYLGLPAGWRFLVADDYEDIWFDESLLKI